jgi:CxxC motif-containing protein (DUF1111 family)
MKHMMVFMGIVGALAACNGSDDSTTTAQTAQSATPQAEAGTPADAAESVRKTIEALRRGGGATGGAGAPPPSLPPSSAKDPGPRPVVSGPGRAAGEKIASLTPAQSAAYDAGLKEFTEADDVEEGLGPTMNLDSCGGCHSHPAIGGSSPPKNPQIAFAAAGADKVPSFLTETGPIREVRFVRNPDGSPDGGVHGLFTITGREGADGCNLSQPDFAAEQARNNVVFRIPTPLFGAGLIESIPDREILQNQGRSAQAKQALGIRGRPNVLLTSSSISGQPNKNGNDGTIGRFGHKAQNKSLLIFSGEAYNVEMGITNGAFPTERDETEGCLFAPSPNTDYDLDAKLSADVISAIDRFTLFMRFLAAPTPVTTTFTTASATVSDASIAAGRKSFDDLGCALCHTPSLRTYASTKVPALGGAQAVNLFSDLLLHDMGRGLADGVQQGQAGGREWRSAPLWGLGQRLFFLHDGRTSDLRQAIGEHASDGSEANGVTRRFFALPDAQQQDVLNFLRSL